MNTTMNAGPNATVQSITEQFPYWAAAFPAPLTDTTTTHVILGCGTSYNLALSIASALNERGIPALAIPAGEWTIRPQSYLPAGTPVKVIALSRSGETTETVAAARISRTRGQHVTAITCAPGSSLSANSDTAIEFPTHPAEGVVMTVSASLMLLAGYALAGQAPTAALTAAAEALLTPASALPSEFHAKTHVVFLGAGSQYGIALEGALKLQEMALTFTQAFHPGEYRHGPVSLIDQHSAVVMLYHPDTAADEAILVSELQAKGAFVLGFGGPGDITLPITTPTLLRGAETLPALQIIGEQHARARGIDTTAPRHLTKVVVLA